jgi:predicted deacylase
MEPHEASRAAIGSAPPTPPPQQPPMPNFEVRLTPPDLRPWRAGNRGIPGFTTLEGRREGPHVMVTALVHGNEIAGAIVLDRLLRADPRPRCGRLTLGFVNMAAFERFDARQPTASRFIDEDFNRVWDAATLQGPRHSAELARAREVRPLIDTVDVLLDLHSMLWPSVPLMLSGSAVKGGLLAARIGTPPLVVSDAGHATGRRMIDYGRFTDPATRATANLLEAGQHWEPATVDQVATCVAGLMTGLGVCDHALPAAPHTPQRFARVTDAVIAATSGFAFVQPCRGGDVIPRRNTLIALDGDTEVRTPHDDCLLIMPSLRPSRGHMAVRLAQFCDPPS